MEPIIPTAIKLSGWWKVQIRMLWQPDQPTGVQLKQDPVAEWAIFMVLAMPGLKMARSFTMTRAFLPEHKPLFTLGNTNPDWKGSFGSEFKYKNFRLNALFDGQFGGVAYSLTHAVLMEEGKLKKTIPGRYNGIIGDGVRFDAATSKYVKNDIVATNIQAYYDAHFNRDNVEANTFSTDFIKLREVRLDYTFTAKTLKKIGLQKASLGVYGRDLWVKSNWPSFDPEFGTLNDGQINAGFEIGQFPSTRSYGIALTIGL